MPLYKREKRVLEVLSNYRRVGFEWGAWDLAFEVGRHNHEWVTDALARNYFNAIWDLAHKRALLEYLDGQDDEDTRIRVTQATIDYIEQEHARASL